MFAWLGKASPKKSSKKSKNKVENTTNGGVISKENHSNGRILSFRKLKSFKKDAQEEENEKVLSSSPSLRCEGFTKPSQSPVHSIDLAHSKDSGVLDLNPNGNRSGHCCYPLPSPNRVTNKSDEGLHSGWESAASSTASDEHDADPAHPPASSGGEVKEKEGRVDVMKLTPKLAPRPQNLPISGKRGLPAKQLQIPVNRALGNATDSSMSSPSSPMRNFDPTAGIWGLKHNHDLVPTLASTNCSSPGSGANSTVGDVVGQHHRSPVLSPRFRSPGPSSRAHSNAVSPRHPRAAGTDSPKDGRNQHVCHPLPLPPRSPSSAFCNVASSSPSPRSPASRDNPASPGHRWKKGKLIGRGTFGHVYAGFNRESGEMCAMKEVTLFSDDPKSKESVKQLGQEISMLSYLRHSNIVQYYGSEMVNDTLYIYLEYVSGGSIHKLLQEYGQFGEPAIRSYTQQILSGLAYLHNKNTVHRDIKGANILVDPNGHVKLADFGMAKHISSGSCMLSFKGSPYWMAPEVFKNSNGYDLAVDIWSLGCTVIEMATARPPWSQYEGVAAMFKIGNSKELPEIPGHLSDEGKNFLKLCLQRDPADRPTAAQLLEHPFVKDANLYIRVDNTDIKEMPTGMRNLQNGMQHGGHSRCPSSVEMDYCATTNRGWQHHQPLSEQFYMHKNISMPVSPSGSPLIPPRSPLHRHGGMSSSPMSTPLASSGCSTPQTGGYEPMAYQANVFSRPSMFVQENSGNISKYLLGPNSNSNLFGMSINTKPEILGGLISNTRTPEGSPRLQKCFAAENDVSGKMFCRKAANEAMPSPGHYSGQMALAEHVSQQLLKSPSQPTVDMKAVSSLHALQNGKELY